MPERKVLKSYENHIIVCHNSAQGTSGATGFMVLLSLRNHYDTSGVFHVEIIYWKTSFPVTGAFRGFLCFRLLAHNCGGLI